MTVRKTMNLVGLFAILLVIPLLTNAVMTPSVEAADLSVTRTPESLMVAAGSNLTMTITPAGFGGFYAVDENIGGLTLISHTADNLADDKFIQLQGTEFEYVVKVPESAKRCDTFDITGLWWEKPTDKLPFSPATSTITVAPCVPIEANDDSKTAITKITTNINVVANDKGDSTKVTAVTDPLHGGSVIVDDSTVSYTSHSEYVGNDEFVYTITDAQSNTATATLFMTIKSPPPTGLSTAPFSLLPASSTQPIGKKFKIQIWTNAVSTQNISGVEVYVDFDPVFLQVVDSNSTQSGVQIKPVLSKLNTPFKNEVDNAAGKIDFASGTFVTPYPSGTFQVAEIEFQGIKISTSATDITFSFAPGRTTTASVSGAAILGQHENASVTLPDVTLIGKVVLQGGNRPVPDGWVVPITVNFFEPGTATPVGTPCITTTTMVSGAAEFQCSAVTGTFDIVVDSEHTLANIRHRVLLPDPSTSGIVDFGVLSEGGANDDGIVNITDFTILVPSFGICKNGTGFDRKADFDRNGCVNILDFTLLSNSFLMREPIPVP